MNEPETLFLAAELLGDARSRVDACSTELRDLLAKAQHAYEGALSELEGLSSAPGEKRPDTLLSRVEMLRRVEVLRDEAGDLDTGIVRLRDALTQLDGAAESLEGRVVRLRNAFDQSEDSIEAVAIQAQEEERYRLAREIHDGPAQILANVALQLEYISKLSTRDPVRAKDEMDTIQKDLRLAVGEVRRFMYDLRPPALAQQGVGPAVESHCQRLAQRFGLDITVSWQSAGTLQPSQETALFRIVQEALQNVVKHAQATRVEVRAAERDGRLEVAVTDNGKGFDPGMIRTLDPNHFGLAGVRARAQQIGATLELVSSQDSGTTVLLRVPLASNAEQAHSM